MGKLIKAEALKFSKLFSFGILLFIAVLMGIGLTFLFNTVAFSAEYEVKMNGLDMFMCLMGETPDVLLFAPSAELLIPVFAAIFLVKEFMQRTFGLSIARGCSRTQLLLAKFVLFLIGTSLIAVAYLIAATLTGTAFHGFGEFDLGTGVMFAMMFKAILLFLLEFAAIAGFSVFLAVLTKNSTATIAAGMLILTMYYALSSFILPWKMTSIAEMVQPSGAETPFLFILRCLILLTLSIIGALVILRKSELK
jgi:ABC-type transport system involved in multi-copper enzyme maturation permease subunit